MKLRNLCTGLAALAATMVSIGTAPSVAQDKKPYVIYLSNNFVGNDWRQQMQRVAQVSVDKGPLTGRVDLKIEVAENTVQAQINSLNNIIRQKPDAILVDAGSDYGAQPDDQEGLRRRHRRHQLRPGRDRALRADARLGLGPHPGGDGRVDGQAARRQGQGLLDRGLAGAPISAQLQDGYEKVLANYPDIKVVGYYNGEYALGPEQSGVAALLAANPQVDGILTQGYGSGAIQALKDAGRPIVPVVGFSYNVAALTCAETQVRSASSARTRPISRRRRSSSPSRSSTPASGRPSVRSRSKATSSPPTPFESKLFPDTKMQTIEVGKNAFPDQAPGLTLPITPDWVEITAAEAAGTK